MNPGDRPRRGVVGLLALVAGAAVVALPILVDTEEAAADELQPFGSCEELAAWGAESPVLRDVDEDLAAGAAESGDGTGGAAPGPLAERAADDTSAATGDTNVIVEGVDELDTVDRVDERHVLLIAGGTLALVEPADGAVLASLDVPEDARLTFDPDARLAWVVGTAPEGGTTVLRVEVGDDGLTPAGSWSTSGWLVDARRTGDRLHLVAVEGFVRTLEDGTVPFEEGPVPCDEVLHPTAPSNPEATLLVTLPSSGALEPTHAAEVVGAGQLIHVTAGAAYLATPLWETDRTATSIHRFDLETLAHTGSGRVEGTLLNQFAMSEHEGHLRLAVTHGGGFGIAIEDGDIAVADGGAEPLPATEPADALNEIVALDTDGDLDVVGRTPRFGHPGETLQGIRFVGEVAYAVTFLQTDPFYVVDLSDPATPQVVGEVELPGFSAYLHPIADGLVLGFGPDGQGQVGAKLFDVSDPAAPQVVDEEPLGDDSPVVWDHHAFTSLGDGRFAVPSATYRTAPSPRCAADHLAALEAEIAAIEQQLSTLEGDQAAIEPLVQRLEELYGDPCLSAPSVVDTTVVVADAGAGTIEIEQRLVLTADEPGSRVLPTGDGWAVLVGTHLVVLDAAGGVVHDLAIA